MGAVSAFGWGMSALDAVFDGKSAAQRSRIGNLPGAPEALVARLASPLPSNILDRQVEDADQVAQAAVFAAHEAMQMAGVNPQSVGMLAWGSGYGGAFTLDAAYTRLLFGKSDLSGRVSPLTVPKAMTHASAAGIAAWLKLTCPVMTYSCACASSAVAIGEAMLAIASGRCEVALVGGSEALIVPGVVKAWSSLGALAQSDEHQKWFGPFDQSRNGLVLGEGAACLVLESVAHAAQRNANMVASVRGYGNVHDPDCITHPNAEPQIQAMQAALRHARADSKDIAYVNAHATGTRAGDASEITALNAVFGDSRALVSSSKGATGHLMGAAGALESIIAIQALRTVCCPPNVSLNQPDTNIRFQLADKPSPIDAQGLCLTNSFAFGGTNVSLVFGV